MVDDNGSVSLDGYLPLKALLVLRQILLVLVVFVVLAAALVLLVALVRHGIPRPCLVPQHILVLVEPVVGFLQERHVVVQFLKVERTVDVEVAVRRDGVSERCSVVEVGTTHPCVGSRVVGVGVHPVEYWDEVQRQLIRCVEVLLVVEWRSEVADTLPYRVLPSVVLVRVEVLVDDGVRLLDLSVGSALEVHVQVLREVPAQGEVAVPQELLVECHRQVGVLGRLHVTLLQLIVVSGYLRVECDILRQVVQSEALEYVKPFRLCLDNLAERLPCLVVRSPAVVEGSAPVVLVLIDGRLALVVGVRVAVGY